MTPTRISMLGISALLMLSACGGTPIDWDLRGGNRGLSTSSAARSATQDRPTPDARGVISYPGYQVAVAQRGDTVASVAARIGVNADELARYNALKPGDGLRSGEVLALPGRVSAAPAGTTGQIIGGPNSGGPIDVSTIATTALDRVGPSPTTAPRTSGAEPVRHKVARGETAFTIARSYNVSAKSLADWNGLGPDLSVREGQFLIIPVAGAVAPPFAIDSSAPGQGSAPPEPPSAKKPLPAEKTTPAADKTKGQPASPDLGAQRTSASASRFVMPLDGKIIRTYVKKKNDGIDIAAAAGSPVKAAADGTVAAVTTDTEGTPIIVIRHADNILTVYAGVDGAKVAKGAAVKRGQTIATVRAGNPAFLHFEVRKGVESVDPMPYVQ
ncbi:MAG: peptidoglycan DD-metalloendopeptidase family protein [Cypionkella sp.]|nr:LysM peptidoglycan-binding domain-containing M23 family metallopeptidase [Cypionkella sp.]